MNAMEFTSKQEQLDYEVTKLMRESSDPGFNTYLKSVLERLHKNPDNVDLLRDAMLQNFQTYCKQMAKKGVIIPDFMEVVYPGMGEPVVIEPITTQEAPTYSDSVDAENADNTDNTDNAENTENRFGSGSNSSTGRYSGTYSSSSAFGGSAYEEKSNSGKANGPASTASSNASRTAPRTASNVMPKKKDMEFTVGIVVLSIVGAFFILAAAAMFVSNFMGSFAKCILLYLICVVFFIVSEKVVRNRIPKLSSVISSLSISAVMIITLVECFALELFPVWVAIAILFAVSLFTTYLGWLKKSELFFLIGFVGDYISLSLVYVNTTQMMFILVLGIFLVVSKYCLRVLNLDKKFISFAINDTFLIAIVGFFTLSSFADGVFLQGSLGVLAIILSFLVGGGFLTMNEVIEGIALVFCVKYFLPEELSIYALPVCMGIGLAVVVAAHMLPWLKDKYSYVLSYSLLVGDSMALLMLMDRSYGSNYWFVLICFVFALGTLLLFITDDRYAIAFAGNYLPVAILLTYFALVLRIDVRLVNSAIMMIIALVCVILGFVFNQKHIRIYGLVLALLTCGKIVLFDFYKADTLTKTLLYFAIGVLALLIAGVYIYLERKEQLEEENASVTTNQAQE